MRPAGCWAPKNAKAALEQTSGRQRLNIHGAIDLETGATRMIEALELSEDGMVRRMPDPLNYGSFREWCRHRLGLGTDKGRCI